MDLDLDREHRRLAQTDAKIAQARACVNLVGRGAALQRLLGMDDSISIKLVATLQHTHFLMGQIRARLSRDIRLRRVLSRSLGD